MRHNLETVGHPDSVVNGITSLYEFQRLSREELLDLEEAVQLCPHAIKNPLPYCGRTLPFPFKARIALFMSFCAGNHCTPFHAEDQTITVTPEYSSERRVFDGEDHTADIHENH